MTENELSKNSLRNYKYDLAAFTDWCQQEGIDNMNDVTGRTVMDFRMDRTGEVKQVILRGNLWNSRSSSGSARRLTQSVRDSTRRSPCPRRPPLTRLTRRTSLQRKPTPYWSTCVQVRIRLVPTRGVLHPLAHWYAKWFTPVTRPRRLRPEPEHAHAPAPP